MLSHYCHTTAMAGPQLLFAPSASSWRAWWLCAAWHSKGEAQPLGAEPPPRVLALAASKVADSTALDHVGREEGPLHYRYITVTALTVM